MINPEDYYARINQTKDNDFRQDIYLKILIAAPNFKGTKDDFDKYLSTIIKNHKKDRLKENLKADVSSLDEPTNEGGQLTDYFPADRTNVQTQIEARYELEKIKDSVQDNEYRLLELFFEEGYTADEIIEKYPELNFKDTFEIYNLIKKYKKWRQPTN